MSAALQNVCDAATRADAIRWWNDHWKFDWTKRLGLAISKGFPHVSVEGVTDVADGDTLTITLTYVSTTDVHDSLVEFVSRLTVSPWPTCSGVHVVDHTYTLTVELPLTKGEIDVINERKQLEAREAHIREIRHRSSLGGIYISDLVSIHMGGYPVHDDGKSMTITSDIDLATFIAALKSFGIEILNIETGEAEASYKIFYADDENQ